jgi:hypothetical protein
MQQAIAQATFPFIEIGILLISLIATWFISRHFFLKSKPKKTIAYKLLREFRKKLEQAEIGYYITKSGTQNYQIANFIYTNSDHEVIGTSFFENPSKYGESDLARLISKAKEFTRISDDYICDAQLKSIVKKNMKLYLDVSSKFIIIPKTVSITKIDGVFSKFSDDSHLCFISLRDPENSSKNTGIVFCDGLAKNLFEYYHTLAKSYK